MVGKLRRSVSLRWRVCAGILLVLVALAGCGRNYFAAERDPWRRDAEIACLKAGNIRESAALVRADPIKGPGMCGADFPLKVTALGTAMPMGYAGELRPPGAIPGAAAPQPPWPAAEPRAPTYRNGKPVPSVDPGWRGAQAQGAHSVRAPAEPLSILPPAVQRSGSAQSAYERPAVSTIAPADDRTRRRSIFDAPSGPAGDDAEEDEFAYRPAPAERAGRAAPAPATRAPQRPAFFPLGPQRGLAGPAPPVEVKPTATLACPIVSALDRWIAEAIQPSARRWFGQPVAEIRQISAYSCRGMNGQRGARISEHAFGNALDIAAFVLADGRRITVKNGWRGTPEEQGFLRDVQGAACEQFTTVLAPGSNRFHYDHIHVDLMRRASGRSICNPDAVPGEVIAARAAKDRGFALKREPAHTGSIGKTAKNEKPKPGKIVVAQEDDDDDDWIEDDGPREQDE